MKRIEASLYGFIVGDALGVPVEFISREVLNKHKITDMISNATRRTSIGYYSDDTAMTLCTMQSIIDRQSIDYKDMIEKFFLWFKQGYMAIDNKCFGIGKTTLKAMNAYMKLGYPHYIDQQEYSPKNRGNGSLMRILPVSLFLYAQKDLSTNEKFVAIEYVSSLTHSDKVTKMACVFYSLLVFSIMDLKDFKGAYDRTVSKFKQQYLDYDVSDFQQLLTNEILDLDSDFIESSGYVIHTLEACLWCFFTTDNYKDAVLSAVNLGYDTDTIAALSGALAGLLYGIKDIPLTWLSNLREKEKLDSIVAEFCETLGANKATESNFNT